MVSKFSKNLNKKFQSGASSIKKFVNHAPENLNTASNVLSKTSDVLGKVSSVTNKILNNPLTAGIVAANPELLPFYAGAEGVNAGLMTGAKITGKASNITGQLSNSLEKNKSSNVQQYQ